ncbi:MAG TPA: hypothetical protein ENJ08_07460 [Gammaproteobacteria bacterium]|nr:hypothetical protein [Gammaproteobacteria bacterium]
MSSQFQVSPADLSQVLWNSMSIYMQKSISNDDIHFVVDRYLQIYLSQLVETTGMSLDRIKQVVTQQLVLDSEDAPSLNTESLIIQIDSVSEYEIERAEHEISTLQVMHPDSEACSSEYIPADKAEQKIVELLFNEENKSFESGDTIAVGNAGMVLGAHYMPLLFERLELTQQGQFVNDESAFKAICLLRYLVYGEDSDKADDSLLSYIICGLQSGQTTPDREIIVDIELHESDKAMVDSLLGNIIQQWSALGKTSCNGLRETFLQREGLLTYLDDAGWRLNVNSSPFDVLLDRIPWSYSTIKYSFMPEVIQVDWRSGGNL